MTGLARLQHDFMAMLLAPQAPADARLAIYYRGARASWRSALCAAYPVVRRLVGCAFFDAAADEYARRFPSASGDLGDYGARLAAFLESYAPARGLDYLADVARLEWALHESARAAQAPRFDAAALEALPEERHGALRLRLDPSVRLLESRHPVVAIWEANQPGRDGTPRRTGGDRVLVARGRFEARPRSLAPADWRFLQGVAAGRTLSEMVEAMGAEAAEIPAMVARHAARGVICGWHEA